MTGLDLSGIPIVDHHAHNLMRPELITPATFLGAFTESPAPAIATAQVRDTLSFRRSLADLGAVFDSAPDLDAILAFPLLSSAGLRSICRELFELTPLSKIFYSSDGHVIPELFYLAATSARRTLAGVLDEAVRDGDLTATGADTVAAGILRDNVRRWYGLEAPAGGPRSGG